jgi:amino acid transporter
MTSFPDYGLKAQGIEPHGAHGGYRSIFQPYAGMYVVFWYVYVFQLLWNDSNIVGRSTIFIFVSGLSVFWHFNSSDFIAACK